MRPRTAFRLLPVVAVLVSAVGLQVTPAHAGVDIPIHVTSTADLPDTNTADSTCMASNGKCTLRAGVQTANADSGNAYRIVLRAGTYTLTRTPTGEDAAAGGDLDLLGNVTINGRGAGKTTVRIDRTKVKDRVFQLIGPFAALQGMTISGGLVPAGDPKGDGGAVESDGNELRLVNDVLTGNQAAVSGGAVANQSGSLYVIDTTIAGNTALDNGGAIRGYHPVILQGATISGNHAGGGGGAIDSTDQVLATNATIVGNSAEFDGGGIRGGDQVELFSSTVVGNGTHKGTGGNLNGDGASVFLTDSILAKPKAGGNCHATVSADHSLIDHTGGCTVTGSGNVIGQDPMLGPLHPNGGRTATMALLVGSPAINAGTSTGCPETDQRGVVRPQGQHCDIGAYETPFPKVTAPKASVVHSAKFTVAWEVTSGGPAAKFFDVRYRDKLPGHPFGAFHALVDHTTAHHKGFTGESGREYCFSADAIDPGGNTSPFGPEHCVTVSH